MKLLIFVLALLSLATLGWVQLGAGQFAQVENPMATVSGTVVKVLDGDSFRLQTAGGQQRVELAGIDAPDIGQAYAAIATGHLSDLILGRQVTVHMRERNDFGELVGEVWVDEISINRLMLTDGYAWAKRGRTEDPSWAGLEALARNKGFGLWRDDDPVSPWDYREQISRS